MVTGAAASYASDDENKSYQPKDKTPEGWQKFWTKEHSAALKRMGTFRKQGSKIVRRFLDERADGEKDIASPLDSHIPSRLNLFHTNIVTLQSMLFGSTPKIEVDREHADPDDDVARVASMMYQRILDADNCPSGDDLGTTLRAALQDRLLPGLGAGRVRYEIETAEQVMQGVFDTEGNPVTQEILVREECLIEYLHWQDVLWGWCRTWSECPWLGFRSWMDKPQATARFGADICKNLEFKQQVPDGNDNKDSVSDADHKNNIEKAEIWEFWNKSDRRVYWWSPGAEQILDIKDDPLRLDGFWPMPRPMMANVTTTMLIPRGDFVISQDLYNEIDILQSRIATITRAIKVVGVYDKAAGDSVGRMLKEGVENDLIPVDNWAMFAEKGGLKGQIDWFPVQDVVNVLQVLNTVQEEKIAQLFQITGMSDIMRGGNQQYTAAATEQLKAKFGSIRVQALQDEFARFASDLDNLKAEVISKHFSPETILVQSNASYLPESDRQLVGPALQLMKSEQVKWRVTIRPESVAMVDYAQIKAERSEFLTAMATFLQSANSMVSAVPGSLPYLLQMLKWGMAGFKGSNELEGAMDKAIEQAQNAPQQDPNQQQQAQQQMDMQKAQMEHQMEMQRISMKHQGDMQVLQTKMQGELEKIARAHFAKMAEQQAKEQADMRKIVEDLQADLTTIRASLEADIRTEQSQAANAAAEAQVDHENELVEMAAEHRYNMTEMGADAAIQASQDARRLQASRDTESTD